MNQKSLRCLTNHVIKKIVKNVVNLAKKAIALKENNLMAVGVSVAYFESLRSIASGSISASYAAIGTPTTRVVKAFSIANNTQGDMIISLDSSDAAGHMFVPAGAVKVYDIQANMNPQFDDQYVFKVGTQFYVKQSTPPVSGDVWVECIF